MGWTTGVMVTRTSYSSLEKCCRYWSFILNEQFRWVDFELENVHCLIPTSDLDEQLFDEQTQIKLFHPLHTKSMFRPFFLNPPPPPPLPPGVSKSQNNFPATSLFRVPNFAIRIGVSCAETDPDSVALSFSPPFFFFSFFFFFFFFFPRNPPPKFHPKNKKARNTPIPYLQRTILFIYVS